MVTMAKYEWVMSSTVCEDGVEDINKLLFQLSKSPRSLTLARAKEIAEKSFWLGAIDDVGKIKGMGALTISHLPTGRKGFIDDVVVDQSMRGLGIGEQLVIRLVERARQEAVNSIELTSKPSRMAANSLYRKIGFQQRETNCYILKLQL